MKRDVLVDRLKGYACFLVLFGHVSINALFHRVLKLIKVDILLSITPKLTPQLCKALPRQLDV